MKFKYNMMLMFISGFLIQYFIMPPFMVSNTIYITNNIGKAYIATIMGLLMIVFELIMHDHQHNVLSINLYSIIFSLLALFTYLYRKQIYVNDKEYLKNMIEHHSMAVFSSNEILKKTDNYDIAKLAKNVISQQTDELRVMNELLKK